MEIAEKFLPIGTIVKLKNIEREIMIASYCVVPRKELSIKDKKLVEDFSMTDYGGCYYPDGYIVSSRIIAFNHDQIEKVIFMGYDTEESKQYSEKMVTIDKNIREMVEKNSDKPNNETTPVIPIEDTEIQ